jgi:hypothetical protein
VIPMIKAILSWTMILVLMISLVSSSMFSLNRNNGFIVGHRLVRTFIITSALRRRSVRNVGNGGNGRRYDRKKMLWNGDVWFILR